MIKQALREDVGPKDITSSSLFDTKTRLRAEIESKEAGILCGIDVVERVFQMADEDVRFLPEGKDGDALEPGREIAYVEGSARSILIAERTALNFLGRLCGIATLTSRYVEKVRGTKAKIMDTRKTTPGLRALEKMAVASGGGVNHRMGLYDQVLIKDNHLRVLKNVSIPEIVRRVQSQVLRKTVIGLEVKNLDEFSEALKTGASYVLLDNMSVETVREAVKMRQQAKSKIELEVSGGINLETVRVFAETGVERISVGALTHSAKCLDVSLDIVGA